MRWRIRRRRVHRKGQGFFVRFLREKKKSFAQLEQMALNWAVMYDPPFSKALVCRNANMG